MQRKSFASIETKIHPNINDFVFDFKDTSLDSKENEQIVEEMMGVFFESIPNDNDGTGEWEYLQKRKQNNFIDALYKGKIDVVSKFLTNMFRNEATYGYLSPSFSDAVSTPNSVKSDILCNIDSCFEFSDICDVVDLTTDCGNPYGLKIDGRFVLPDTPRHFYYSYNISKLLENVTAPVLIEIGGGYGGLCLQNWRRFEGNCTIVNMDLFPALAVTYFYLMKNRIPVNLITEKKCDVKDKMVNLILSDEVKNVWRKIPRSDLIFNSRSLCEMDKNTISEYFNLINFSKTKFFYHENSNYLLFPNSERHIEVVADKFPIDKKKFKLISKYLTPFTGGNGRYREYIYKGL
tara:strand:- start:1300 stop:2343 length:1044 start_codon:yes stop_codon:yes gene_type:complete